MEKPSSYGNDAPQSSRLFEKQPSTTRNNTFASLSMHMDDRLRLMQFSDADFQAIRRTINTCWPKGVQDEKEYHGSHEFKLRGNPWRGSGNDAVYARRFMCKVLETLANIGWVVVVSTDISKTTNDKDTLLFRYQRPPPAPCDWMAISFSNNDLIRFIDAPLPLIDYMIENLGAFIQRHERHQLEGAYEFKLHGYPWYTSGGDTMKARQIALKLLEGLDYNGWTIYASVDQKTTAGGNSNMSMSETDTWHCCRPIGWTPGLPAYQS